MYVRRHLGVFFMLEEFPRNQLYSIIQRYGQSLVEDTRRCKGLLKDLAPKHQRETNLLLLVLEHKLIGEIIQETQLPVSVKLDRLAQKLHDNVGIQKDFAFWAVESWAIALDISPVTDTFNQIVEDTENEKLFELGQKFHKNEEYDKAHEYYLLAAEKGHADSQYVIGLMYAHGIGIEKNIDNAFKWYKLAAEKGHAESPYQIGHMYEYGEGIEINEQEAFKWYKLAAEQEDRFSMIKLAKMYELGLGVEINEQEAFKWCKLAAEKGSSDSMKNLGRMYECGLGIQIDYEESIKWYLSAAKKFSISSRRSSKHKDKELDCYISAAKLDNTFALNKLKEYGDYKNDASLCKWRGCYDLGRKAQFNLGEIYYYGTIFIEENKDEAFKWYRFAAAGYGLADVYYFLFELTDKENDIEAQYSLGWINSINSDMEEAIEYFELAANQGHDEAKKELAEIYYELGCNYENGEDVEQNITKAIKYFRLAAEYGHPAAQLVLAETLYHGLGMEEESIKWYQRATAQQFDVSIDDVEKALMQALEI
jgi:TPR repeat protein